MYLVTRVDPLSWAKAYTLAVLGVLAVVFGVFGVLVVAAGLIASAASEGPGPTEILTVGLVGGAAWLAVVSLLVFVVSLVQAAAFNWALGRTGGLEVDLALAHPPAPPDRWDAPAGGMTPPHAPGAEPVAPPVEVAPPERPPV